MVKLWEEWKRCVSPTLPRFGLDAYQVVTRPLPTKQSTVGVNGRTGGTVSPLNAHSTRTKLSPLNDDSRHIRSATRRMTIHGPRAIVSTLVRLGRFLLQTPESSRPASGRTRRLSLSNSFRLSDDRCHRGAVLRIASLWQLEGLYGC